MDDVFSEIAKLAPGVARFLLFIYQFVDALVAPLIMHVDPRMRFLVTAAVITVFLWQVPFGNLILYPFTILATWFHEMGHGVTALILGGDFRDLKLYANGSGLATYTTDVMFGRYGHAMVAAGGPIGPPLAGALFLLTSRTFATAHWALIGVGITLVFSAYWWIRTTFGWIATTLLAAGFIFVAAKGAPALQIFAVQFLGVQACISTFRQINYLFTKHAAVGGKMQLSDTGQMAEKLFFPYWFWGAALTAATIGILYVGLQWAVSV
ncbi:MAG: M50 family metallopeptidase [Planctomycetales bacterium]